MTKHMISLALWPALLCLPLPAQSIELEPDWRAPTASTAWSVALGDVDNDQDLDAWVTELGAQADRIWLNDGQGVFSPGPELEDAGNAGRSVALGDLDSDQDLDAIVVNGIGATQVWYNNGAGIYTQQQSLGDNDSFSHAVTLGDVDQDGDLDAWVAVAGSNRVWLNDGTGLFLDSGQRLGSSPSLYSALGDLDGDGDLDAWVANRGANAVWFNDGNGVFSRPSGTDLGSSHSRAVMLGDLDGDGDLDAWVANANSDPAATGVDKANQIWLNDGLGGFRDSGQLLGDSNSDSVALADLDRDGDLDAWVLGDWDGSAAKIWLNDGQGRFSDSGQSVGAGRRGQVALGDLDGDGDADAWVAQYFGRHQVWRNTQAFRVTETDGHTTVMEGGTEDSIELVLLHRPDGIVSLDLSTSPQLDLGSGPGVTHSVIFTPENWAMPQTVFVTAVDDALGEGLHSAPIRFLTASSDPDMHGLSSSDLIVAIQDNDNTGIMVMPTAGLVTGEAGEAADFGVVLTAQPTASVTIDLSSSVEAEGIPTPSSLTFTATNWDQEQLVTVIGQDDDIADGSRAYNILTAAAVSTDALYNGLDAADVSVINIDNDQAGVSVSLPDLPELLTSEAGDEIQFTVALDSEPLADVVIDLSSSDNDEGRVEPDRLLFTAENWFQPRNVRIMGIDDTFEDGPQLYSISITATSDDPAYDRINLSPLTVSNSDDGDVSIPLAAGQSDHDWQTIEASDHVDFARPIVILGPPTAHDTEPGVLQLSQVSGNAFQVKFSEWVPSSTAHTAEQFSYLMASERAITQADGSVWVLGHFELSGTADWQQQRFSTPFNGVPALFLTAQTSNGEKPFTLRARDVTADGFEAALFEAEIHMDGHTPETVAYLAIYSPTGSGVVDLGQGEQAYLLQQADINSDFTPVLSARLKLEEEQSLDAETHHVDEAVNVLALGQQLFAQAVSARGSNTVALRQMAAEDPALLEWGLLRGVTHDWMQVPLIKDYRSPVVIVKPVSSRGGQAGVIRLQNVAADRFELRYSEWQDALGVHQPEQAFYLVAEAGSQTLAGLQVEAGAFNSDRVMSEGWEPVHLNPAFGVEPWSVLSAVQTYRDPEAVITRVRPVSNLGFDLTMQEQQANTDGHDEERLGWIAIQQGQGETASGRTVEVLEAQVDSQIAQVHFTPTQGRYPVVVSGAMSSLGVDPFTLRYRAITDRSIELYLQEEQSLDEELAHTSETIGVFVAQ